MIRRIRRAATVGSSQHRRESSCCWQPQQSYVKYLGWCPPPTYTCNLDESRTIRIPNQQSCSFPTDINQRSRDMAPLPDWLAWYLKFLTILTSLASIGVSSWQFQSSNQDYYTYGSFSDFICDNYPYKYLRPFSLTVPHNDTPYFCGWSEMNTGFRLFTACYSVISLSILLYLKKKRDEETQSAGFCTRMFTTFNVTVLILLWYAAACIDCGNLSQAEVACKDKFVDQSNCDDCDCAGTSVYGTSIGIDFLCLFPLIMVTFCQGENASGGKQSLASQSQQV